MLIADATRRSITVISSQRPASRRLPTRYVIRYVEGHYAMPCRLITPCFADYATPWRASQIYAYALKMPLSFQLFRLLLKDLLSRHHMPQFRCHLFRRQLIIFAAFRAAFDAASHYHITAHNRLPCHIRCRCLSRYAHNVAAAAFAMPLLLPLCQRYAIVAAITLLMMPRFSYYV